MGISAVTIVVQAVIILVLGMAAVWGWRTAWILSRQIVASDRILDQANAEMLKIKDSLLRSSFQAPSPKAQSKPKPPDPIIRANSSAQVRHLTEQHFGVKPGEDEHVN